MNKKHVATPDIIIDVGGYDARYTFSAKEKPACRNASSGRDDETQYSYFGARYYDSDLSVFLSIDRYAGKYPNLSPYQYCAWNPVNLVDINGDSTRYYHNGQLLVTSHDGLRNAVVDLSNVNMSDDQKNMIVAAGKSKNIDPKYDSDEFNTEAMKWGVKYYTDDYENFYNENHGKKNSDGAIAEYGFLMNLNRANLNMEIVPNVLIESQGKESTSIDWDNDPNVYSGKPYPYSYDSDGHIHNFGGAPSSQDEALMNSNGSTKITYDVIINDKFIYLTNKPNSLRITIPKTNSYAR